MSKISNIFTSSIFSSLPSATTNANPANSVDPTKDLPLTLSALSFTESFLIILILNLILSITSPLKLTLTRPLTISILYLYLYKSLSLSLSLSLSI